jgi:hypothetical protein
VAGVYGYDDNYRYGYAGYDWGPPAYGAWLENNAVGEERCVIKHLNSNLARIFFKPFPVPIYGGMNNPTIRLSTVNKYGTYCYGQLSYKVYTTSTTVPPTWLIRAGQSSLYNVCQHD